MAKKVRSMSFAQATGRMVLKITSEVAREWQAAPAALRDDIILRAAGMRSMSRDIRYVAENQIFRLLSEG